MKPLFILGLFHRSLESNDVPICLLIFHLWIKQYTGYWSPIESSSDFCKMGTFYTIAFLRGKNDIDAFL